MNKKSLLKWGLAIAAMGLLASCGGQPAASSEAPASSEPAPASSQPAPESSEPAPASVEPESVEPESVEPESLEPESLEPESEEPESLEPESLEPESLEPESEEPESVEPESLEPESEEPESLEPESEDESSEEEDSKFRLVLTPTDGGDDQDFNMTLDQGEYKLLGVEFHAGESFVIEGALEEGGDATYGWAILKLGCVEAAGLEKLEGDESIYLTKDGTYDFYLEESKLEDPLGALWVECKPGSEEGNPLSAIVEHLEGDPTTLEVEAREGQDKGYFEATLAVGDVVKATEGNQVLSFYGLNGTKFDEAKLEFAPEEDGFYKFYINGSSEIWIVKASDPSEGAVTVDLYVKAFELTEAYLAEHDAYAYIVEESKAYAAAHSGDSWETDWNRHFTAEIAEPVGKNVQIVFMEKGAEFNLETADKASNPTAINDWGNAYGCDIQ